MARTTGTKRDFLRLTDLDRSELLELLERAAEWKLLGKRGPRPLERQDGRPRLREGLHAHARLLRGRGAPARRATR